MFFTQLHQYIFSVLIKSNKYNIVSQPIFSNLFVVTCSTINLKRINYLTNTEQPA